MMATTAPLTAEELAIQLEQQRALLVELGRLKAAIAADVANGDTAAERRYAEVRQQVQAAADRVEVLSLAAQYALERQAEAQAQEREAERVANEAHRVELRQALVAEEQAFEAWLQAGVARLPVLLQANQDVGQFGDLHGHPQDGAQTRGRLAWYKGRVLTVLADAGFRGRGWPGHPSVSSWWRQAPLGVAEQAPPGEPPEEEEAKHEEAQHV
jgi:hypothetical protein